MADLVSVQVSAEDVAVVPPVVVPPVVEAVVTPEVVVPPVVAAPVVAPEVQVDLDTAATEFITTGDLTAETLAALEAKGFTKAQATTYANGIKAQAEQASARLAERVGGKDTLDTMLTWAKNGGLSEADRTAYDGLMTSGNEAQMSLAVDGLMARHEKALGTSPGKVTGAAAPAVGAVKPFESQSQIVAAMQDKRYATDSAYRNAVAERLRVSNNISV